MLLSTLVNLPTILIGAVVALIFGAVVVRGIRRRKRGESGCGCGCSGCPNSALCHPRQEENPKEARP